MVEIILNWDDTRYRETIVKLRRNTRPTTIRRGLKFAGLLMLEFIHRDFLRNSKPGGTPKFGKVGMVGAAIRNRAGGGRKIHNFDQLETIRGQMSPLRNTGLLLNSLFPRWGQAKGKHRFIGSNFVQVGTQREGASKQQDGGTSVIPAAILNRMLPRNITKKFLPLFLKSIKNLSLERDYTTQLRRRPIIERGQLRGARLKRIAQVFMDELLKGVRKR